MVLTLLHSKIELKGSRTAMNVIYSNMPIIMNNVDKKIKFLALIAAE